MRACNVAALDARRVDDGREPADRQRRDRSTDAWSGNSLAQVKWSRAQVVRISTVQPRSARPSGRLGPAPPRPRRRRRGRSGAARSRVRPVRSTGAAGYRDSTVSAYCGPTGMDICVCGAQVPFMYGGAEQLLENLVGALRAAGHRADLVRLPAAWERERVFDAAMAWRMVPIDADLVIATNFPSYFVRHPRKVVWLFHQHRVAYDLAGLRAERLRSRRRRPRGAALARRMGHPGARGGRRTVHALRTRCRTGSPGSTGSRRRRSPIPRRCSIGCTPGDPTAGCSRRCASSATSARSCCSTRWPMCSRTSRCKSRARAACAMSSRPASSGYGLTRSSRAARVGERRRARRAICVGARGRLRALRRGLRLRDAAGVRCRRSRSSPRATPGRARVGDGRRERSGHRRHAGAASRTAIDRLASDDVLTQRLGQRGRERVASLSWQPVVDALLAPSDGAMTFPEARPRLRMCERAERSRRCCGRCRSLPRRRVAPGPARWTQSSSHRRGRHARSTRPVRRRPSGPVARRWRSLPETLANAATTIGTSHDLDIRVPAPGIDLRLFRPLAPFLRERWREQVRRSTCPSRCPPVSPGGSGARCSHCVPRSWRPVRRRSRRWPSRLHSSPTRRPQLTARRNDRRRHVGVRRPDGRCRAVAWPELGRDHRRAAAVGHAGRRLAEQRHDLALPAAALATEPSGGRRAVISYRTPSGRSADAASRPGRSPRAAARVAELSAQYEQHGMSNADPDLDPGARR